MLYFIFSLEKTLIQSTHFTNYLLDHIKMKIIIALVFALLVLTQSRVLLSNHMAPNCTSQSETYMYVVEDKK
jgi:hypothetical protein